MLSADSLQVVVEEEVVEEEEVKELEEAEEEQSCSRLEEIYRLVSEGCYPPSMNPIRKKNLKRYAQKFTLEDGRLYYVGMKKEEKREVVIDAQRKRQIFLECHFNDRGQHLGQKKTVHRIQTKYYWLGIVRDVVDWIKLCETCQITERTKNLARTPRPLKVDGPWDTVTVEIMGPFPCTAQGLNTHIVLITDYYSKWVEAFPVQKRDAVCVARCISSSVYRYGLVQTVFCSQTADFCQEVSKQLCERWTLALKVQHSVVPDRANALLRDTVRQVVTEKQNQWDEFLDPVLSVFRSSVNPVTRFTPYSLMFNRRARAPAQMNLNLLRYDLDAGGFSVSEEAESNFLSSIQEQQEQISQTVFSNMTAAYKQEKKKSKRRSRKVSTITLTVTEPLCPSHDSPSPKKLKDGLFLTFPVETVISSVQVEVRDEKNELEYALPGSDVPLNASTRHTHANADRV